MIGPSETPYNVPADFREVPGRSSGIAILLGMAIIAASIFFGRSYAFFFSFLTFSFIVTILWRNAPRPWIFLVSVSAAVPIAVSRQQFACNLIFALWYAVFNIKYLFRIPQWIYLPAVLAVLGVLISSINWMSGDVVRDLMRQGANAFNFFLAPFLLLPLVYVRLGESRNHECNLQGLLLCLIVPSTLLLLCAKLLGTPVNLWEASLHGESIPDGFLQYQLANVTVNFLRTEVGFILAALVCASTAIVVSHVKKLYRWVAGACLAASTYLLIGVGSFGSGFACLCGLTAMFYVQFRNVNVTRAIVSVTAVTCILLLTYILTPPDVKQYLEERYQFRVVDSGTKQDRFMLWGLALDYFFKHPAGVGLTMTVGDREKSVIHNDYLTYLVSYGVFGGLGYVYLVLGLLIFFFRMRKRLTAVDASLHSIYLAGLGVIVAIAVNSMTDHMNSNRWYFNVMWSMIWYCYFCSCSHTGNLSEEGSESVSIFEVSEGPSD